MTPEVSVVMGVYNGEKEVVESARSILTQQDAALELIIVDDGSTDATPAILSDLARGDSRVRVITQENQGLTVALINGCSEARGRYIARQDAGDISVPGRLAAQQRALDDQADLAFVSCWTEYRGPRDEFLYVIREEESLSAPQQIVSSTHPRGVIGGPTSHASVMFRREMYHSAGGYRREFYFAQDWDLWYRLAEHGKFQILPQTMYVMKVDPLGLSSENRERQFAILSLALEAHRARVAHESEAGLLARVSEMRPDRRVTGAGKRIPDGYYFIGECLRRNGDRRAREYFRAALAADRLHWKSWIRLVQTVALG